MSVTLLGELARHARGQPLASAVGAMPGLPPHAGVAIAFAKELQRGGDATTWLSWVRSPGRALVLVPPFERGLSHAPVNWEARRVEPIAGGETPLGRVLANERQHELRGELVPIERSSGQMITGTWRHHPAAGVLVITALPLWSLQVLERSADLRAWLDDIRQFAGKPLAQAESKISDGSAREPDDWTILLHLATSAFRDREAALNALAESPLFRVDDAAARAAYERIAAEGLADGGTLTAAGETVLVTGPYAREFRELRRMRRGY